VFDDMPRLQYVSCTTRWQSHHDNRPRGLNEIPAGTFDKTPLLRYVSFLGNSITHLPPGLFANNPNIGFSFNLFQDAKDTGAESDGTRYMFTGNKIADLKDIAGVFDIHKNPNIYILKLGGNPVMGKIRLATEGAGNGELPECQWCIYGRRPQYPTAMQDLKSVFNCEDTNSELPEPQGKYGLDEPTWGKGGYEQKVLVPSEGATGLPDCALRMIKA